MPVSVLLGINLWFVALLIPLWLTGGTAAPFALVCAVLCPVVLFLSHFLLRKHPASSLSGPGLLFAVPLLALVPMVDGPLAEPRLTPPLRGLLLLVLLLLYILFALRERQRAGAGSPTAQQNIPLDPEAIPAHWRKRVFLYRVLVWFSIVIPALFYFALHLSPAHLRAFALSFGTTSGIHATTAPSRAQAAFTSALALLWVTTYYACLLSPMRAHLAHDRKAYKEQSALRRLAKRGRPRPQFYLAMTLALGSMILLIWRSLRP